MQFVGLAWSSLSDLNTTVFYSELQDVRCGFCKLEISKEKEAQIYVL